MVMGFVDGRVIDDVEKVISGASEQAQKAEQVSRDGTKSQMEIGIGVIIGMILRR